MTPLYGTKGLYAWKPEQYKHYLSIGEVAKIVNRDTSRIRQLEHDGKIPAPIRIRVGRLSLRLYSAEEAATIGRYFETAKPGRPRKGDAR